MLAGKNTAEIEFFLPMQPRPLQQEEVAVHFDPVRYVVKRSSLLDNMDAAWEAKKAASSAATLFDGTKFRLHAAEVADTTSHAKEHADPNHPHSEPRVTLKLGLTSYKEHVATNLRGPEEVNAAIGRLTGKGADEAVAYKDVVDYLAQPFGNEVLLITADRKLVLYRRSLHVAEYTGALCGAGGHPEPKSIGLPADGASSSAKQEADYAEMSKAVLNELYSSPLEEVSQEIGIVPSQLTMHGLFAIVSSSKTLMKPCALFYASTSMTTAEVTEGFKVHKNKEEVDGGLRFIDFEEALEMVTSRTLSEKFTPCSSVSIAYAVSVLAEDTTIAHHTAAATTACGPSTPIPDDAVQIDFSATAHGRDSTFDALVTAEWERRAKANSRLFNATKFRLAGVTCPADPTNPKSCLIRVGLSCYGDYVGTNLLPLDRWPSAEQVPTIDFEKAMGNALGVEALFITGDDDVVLFRRSKYVGDFAGFYSCPGGHPEPSVVAKRLGLKSELEIDGTNPEHLKSVRFELWDSIVMEVSDEIGVDRSELWIEGFYGVIGNKLTHGKPDLCFQVKTKLSSDEVRKAYAKSSGEDSYESEGPIVLYPRALLKEKKLPKLPLTPPTVACLLLCA